MLRDVRNAMISVLLNNLITIYFGYKTMFYVIVIDNIIEKSTLVSLFSDLKHAESLFLRYKKEFLKEIELCGIEVTITDNTLYNYSCTDGEDDYRLIISRSMD